MSCKLIAQAVKHDADMSSFALIKRKFMFMMLPPIKITCYSRRPRSRYR